MERAVLLRHLAQAERHIAEGEQRLIHQRAVIRELEQDGHRTGSARALLAALEQTQALHFADRERLRAELAHEG